VDLCAQSLRIIAHELGLGVCQYTQVKNLLHTTLDLRGGNA